SLGLYQKLAGNDRAAEKLLNNVLKFAPNTISLHLALARINERKGDTTAAFNEYVTAGVLMYNNRLYDEAKRCLIEAGRLNSSVAGVNYYLAKVYEDTRQLSRALYYYIAANRIQEDTDLMLHIGYIYGVRKEYGLAVRYFNGASNREPKNARPYFFKGLISIWQEDYPAAERHIQRAISFDDTSDTYYFYFAIVMDRLSRSDLAIDSLEKAIRQNPQSGRAYNFLGYIYADRNMKLDRSVELIQKALELEPENGAYIDSLGWAYFRKGEYERALEKLLAAEEILRKADSPDPVVYDHIGDAYLKMGRIDDAIIYWERSIGMKRDDSIEKKIRQHRNHR
ncbi:MAG: tetratricopeptide repeat protein, partial [Chrysiogenales bacterium]